MAVRPIGTAPEHVRSALHLLDELDHEVIALGLLGPERYYLNRMIAATRRQLWLAVVALEAPRFARRSWAQERAWARRRRRLALVGAALGAVFRAVRFVVRSVWRGFWALERLGRVALP